MRDTGSEDSPFLTFLLATKTDPHEVLPWDGSALVLCTFRQGEDPSGWIQEGFLEEEALSRALKKEAKKDRSRRKRELQRPNASETSEIGPDSPSRVIVRKWG